MREPIYTWTFLLSIVVCCCANELTRCCNTGGRHFRKTGGCSSIHTENPAVVCTRSASICCLRALLDQSCDHGTEMAEMEEFCPAKLNEIGGGIRKECCDCCLLAKEVVRRHEECVHPLGFGSQCIRSFNKCCHHKGELSFHQPLLIANRPESMSFLGVGDRCPAAKCEHVCSDRGGETVECSCNEGYDIGPDGTSCIDHDECATSLDGPTMVLSTPCDENEVCENLPGGFRCYERDAAMLNDGTRHFQVIEESALYKREPGSVVRHRHEACPHGWSLDPMGNCADVDECSRGLHDCGATYVCRNTQGSYRCDPRKCADGELMNPRTGECTHVDCPVGFKPNNGRCEDVNECDTLGRCRQFEECINTPGSYRCQEKGNLCTKGYRMDRDTGFCIDINECFESLHLCEDKACINLPGSYKCRCSAGYDFNETSMRCEDIDECKKFAGHVCSLDATCDNTVGSFECHCKEGFNLAADGRNCDDVDECELGIANCAQKCINIPGSYQCICERGYQLSSDGVTCEDIDECSLWAGSGNDLCMGGCTNTPGSYACSCPSGYEIQKDARTCKDIDECDRGECQGKDHICINTLGSFKCHHIECPPNYVHDKHQKNNIEDGYSCLKRCRPYDAICISNHTKEILYQFRTLPSMTFVRQPIEVSRIRAHMDTPFSVQYRIDRWNRGKFSVEQDRNIGIVKLISPLQGPLTHIVRLHVNLYSRARVLLAHNVAIIYVHVSKYFF